MDIWTCREADDPKKEKTPKPIWTEYASLCISTLIYLEMYEIYLYIIFCKQLKFGKYYFSHFGFYSNSPGCDIGPTYTCTPCVWSYGSHNFISDAAHMLTVGEVKSRRNDRRRNDWGPFPPIYSSVEFLKISSFLFRWTTRTSIDGTREPVRFRWLRC